MKKTIFISALLLAGTAGLIAAANTTGPDAEKLWRALDLMAKFENLPIHQTEGDKDTLQVEKLACAYENYYACSFFVKVNGISRMIVDTDAAGKIIEGLAYNGIEPDEDDGTIYVGKVSCTKAGEQFSCVLE